MTRDEAEVADGNEQDRVGIESQPGSMAAAQDAAAEEAGAERERAAQAGDEHAAAELADTNQAHTAPTGEGRPSRIRNAAEWLDDKLVPRLGPSQLGPYDEESDESVQSHDFCPLCGHPMGEHQFDRSHYSAVLICPAERIPKVESYEPLNEVGMPKRSAQGESA